MNMRQQIKKAIGQLTYAKDLLSRPSGWIKGGLKRKMSCSMAAMPEYGYCMLGALREAGAGQQIYTSKALSVTTLQQVTRTTIPSYNDNRIRTKEQVLSKFDAAIEKLQGQYDALGTQDASK